MRRIFPRPLTCDAAPRHHHPFSKTLAPQAPAQAAVDPCRAALAPDSRSRPICQH